MPKKSAKKPKNSSSSKKSSKKEVSRNKPADIEASKTIDQQKVLPATDLYNKESLYCQFDVTNYQKSIKFYTDVLEWKPSKFSESSSDPDTIGWFEFQLPLEGAFLGLGKSQDGKVTPSNSLVIPVKDLEQFKLTMNSKKANPSEITDVPNMISFLTVSDPDNNKIMFISEPRVKT